MVLAALGGAVLASPGMAQIWWNPKVPPSTDNVFWGLAYGPAYAPPTYGSVAHPPAARLAPVFVVVAPPRILDCVHVTFPQCGGGGSGG